MLVIQSANDVRVVQAESDNLVEALRGRGAKMEHMIETRRGTRIRQPGQRDRHVQDRRPLLAEYIR